jgi:hypothetical protein
VGAAPVVVLVVVVVVVVAAAACIAAMASAGVQSCRLIAEAKRQTIAPYSEDPWI